MQYVKEVMSDNFIKYHLGIETKKGLFEPVIHHFTGIHGHNAHDHPWSFTSFIMQGSYVERIYVIKSNNEWSYYDMERKEGTCFTVDARRIHEIIAFPDGECITAVTPKPKERECKFWQFNENSILCRVWNEREFIPYEAEVIRVKQTRNLLEGRIIDGRRQ